MLIIHDTLCFTTFFLIVEETIRNDCKKWSNIVYSEEIDLLELKY